MRISKVYIEKFRSIKKASFNMKNITAIVGENNAGKTSVLRALNAVLNFKYEEESFITKNHQYAPRSNTYITIVFTDIPEKNIYMDKCIDGELTLKFSYTYSANRKKYLIIRGKDQLSIEDDVLAEIAKDITYVYIPAGRSNKDVTWNNNSIFQELVTSYIARHTENRDRISTHVRHATEKIHSSVFSKLEKEINELYLQNKNVDFQIGFPESLDYTVLLQNTEISLKGDSGYYHLREWGSGTKSLAIIALHRANALLNSGNIVLGIEEPEVNLHPQAQKRFIMSLRNQRHSNETQAIFTTHSTVLIDELNHDDIILVRRIKDEARGFYSAISQLKPDFWERNNVQNYKHYQFFKYKNSDFFFAKYVVIGESKNDCQIFEKLVAPEIHEKIADVSFLDAGGVLNIKYPFMLLRELEIPFTIVVDRDYFFPYINNNKLDDSRNMTNGLPIYSDVLNENEVLNSLFITLQTKTRIIEAHRQGYRKFFEEIKNYHILSMNYCLEMDLSCSKSAREKYYQLLNVMPSNQNQKDLLTKYKKSIKDIEKINEILDSIPKNSYPESYKKIKNQIVDDINNYI